MSIFKNRRVSLVVIAFAIIGWIMKNDSLAQEVPANVEWSGGDTKTSQMEDGQLELQETFVFKNTGGSPVAVDRVVASCGCTAPSYTKDIIPIGGAGEVTLKYSTKIPGRGKNLVTKVVFSNGSVAEIKWNINNSPNPSSTPIVAPQASYPLVEWKSGDTESVKIIKVKPTASPEVLSIQGSDKVKATVGVFEKETGELEIKFEKLTDQPFWGAVTLDFKDPSSPDLRINVRSLK